MRATTTVHERRCRINPTGAHPMICEMRTYQVQPGRAGDFLKF
jgi:hypothetical protein